MPLNKLSAEIKPRSKDLKRNNILDKSSASPSKNGMSIEIDKAKAPPTSWEWAVRPVRWRLFHEMAWPRVAKLIEPPKMVNFKRMQLEGEKKFYNETLIYR
jgi:hypothetical protein